jgi:HAMP domain-containing protein/HPt (histidine-containing phosphotransfer) domain-containing protein
LPAPDRPRFLSIGTKLVGFIVVLLSLVGLVLYVELVEREWKSLVRAKRTAAEMVADLFAASLVAPLDFGDTATIEKDLENLGQNGDVVYASVRAEGSASPVAQLHPDAARDLGDPGERAEPVDDRVVAHREIKDPTGKRLGGAVVHFSLAPERAAYDAVKRRILWLSVLLAAGGALLLIAVTRRLIVSPLEHLARAVHEVEEGRAGRVELGSNDELGRLGSAFNAMAAAIVDREQRLGELFDHMRQAILVFGPDGMVERSASRRAADAFGASALAGRAITEILYPGAPPHHVEVRAFRDWRHLVFASPASAFDELAELAPEELAVERDGQKVVLTLEFAPIDRDGRVTRVMLLATDVSETYNLKLAVAASRREHARQMASMRLLVAGGAHQFAGFADEAARRLEHCREIVGAEDGDLEEVFRIVHTLRGEARTFDLTRFEEEASLAEEILAEPSLTAEDRQELLSHLDGARDAIRAATEELVATSPIGRTILDQVTVRRSDLARVDELSAGRDDPLAQAAGLLTARPFGEIAFRQAGTVPPLAEKVGKQVRVDVEGKEVLLPAPVARVLGGALSALCRNAVAHGIERPALREERGKPRAGRVLLACEDGPRSPKVVVADDGAGLDLEGLRARAAELGVAVPEGGAAGLVFVSGLSTAEAASDLAGRGMGLAAVAEDLSKVDWKISVSTEAQAGTRFTLERR